MVGQAQSVGVVTLEKFAELVGIEYGVALGWLKKGYLPTKRIGKYTLVNLVQWNQELAENNETSITNDF